MFFIFKNLFSFSKFKLKKFSFYFTELLKSQTLDFKNKKKKMFKKKKLFFFKLYNEVNNFVEQIKKKSFFEKSFKFIMAVPSLLRFLYKKKVKNT
jgi:hypothetical protein